jgi:hypothetical protein
MWKEAIVAYFEVGYYDGIYLEGLRKTTKRLFSGPGLNPGPPKYEAKMLPTQPRHSV